MSFTHPPQNSQLSPQIYLLRAINSKDHRNGSTCHILEYCHICDLGCKQNSTKRRRLPMNANPAPILSWRLSCLFRPQWSVVTARIRYWILSSPVSLLLPMLPEYETLKILVTDLSYGGFHKWGYPQIINFNWIFPSKPSIGG